MGKGDGGSSSGEVRYAPYLESAHSFLLNENGADLPILSFVEAFNNCVDQSPYNTYEHIDPDEGFFGITTEDPTRTYEIKNYPSLWDIFGKFMGGPDVHDLWGMVYSDVIQGPEIENAISAHSADLQSDIDTQVMPKFLGGMRDINSVQGTAFIVGKSIIQAAHVRAVNKFSSTIRIHALDISNQQWARHLQWNESVTRVYSDIFKLYYASRLDIDRVNLEYKAKDLMWDINLFENARAFLGALGGTAATAGGTGNEPSQGQKAIGGALGGAIAGAQVTGGNPIGAVVGGILGGATAFL